MADIDVGDPKDGRKLLEWTSAYPPEAKKQIKLETCYLFIVFLISLFLIFATWKGWLDLFLPLCGAQTITIKKYAYYALFGMLGGITFGMKYFYRVVARGYWHLDRRTWRIMSPFIAMTVSLMIGIMIEARKLGLRRTIQYVGLKSNKIELAELLSASDIGIIPFDNNPLWRNALTYRFLFCFIFHQSSS